MSEDDALKKLNFTDDNDIMAFRRACINDLGITVGPVAMKAEFSAQGETVGRLISFLSKKVPEAVAV